MSQANNVFIRVRGRLNELSIKLWLEPYYYDDIGSIESEIDKLAVEFSKYLGIPVSTCKIALSELQDGALRKLAARKEFEETGVATFTVRRVNENGTQKIFEIKCLINALGADLLQRISEKLELSDPNQVKCISAGKIVNSEHTLVAQGLKNNQQLLVIVSERDNSSDMMYDRVNKIKMDVETIVDARRQLFEMEDQDGNPVFLPPLENRALLMAMGFCEKARASMKRQQYDEALVLLLEADEKFLICNSRFLETVDNYALVNLDIVWCYLCLKNVTQLPDAQRRLDICERSFRRSYGENMNRLITLKGNSCAERALIMRLHLLQGVVFFHQNQRNEAYEKFETATTELLELKVDEKSLQSLIEMGYEPFEARLGLRSESGNIERAINFIHDRRDKLQEARKRSSKERKMNAKLTKENQDEEWVNPRSVCALIEMGFQHEVVVEALKQSKNDLPKALDLLQSHVDELRSSMPATQSADKNILEQLKELGFNESKVRIALETSTNDLEKSIEFLLKLPDTEEELRATMERVARSEENSSDTPSTSHGLSLAKKSSLINKIIRKAKTEIEALHAYERFNKDVSENDQDYLDLPLIQEEQILAEYKCLLEQ